METGKSRRSSILKPQKLRNPLSDLALIEPDDDVPVTTTRRSIASRRVSFASSNYVKEFATDLEKNTTIWDTTYEETVDKSDSTHSTEITQNPYPFDTQSEKSSVPDTEPTKMPENLNQSYVSMPNEATRKIGSIKYGNRKASLNFNEQGGEDIESDSSLCGTDDFENRIIETRSIQPSKNIMNASVRSTTRQINEKAITQKFIQSGQLPLENADISVKGIRDSLYLPQISSSNTGNISSLNIFRQSQNLHFTEKENKPTESDPTIIIPVLSHRKLCQSIIMADDQCDTSLSKVKPHFKKEDNVLKQNKSLLICNKSSTALKVNNVDNTESIQEGFASNKSSCIMKSETVISNSTMKLTQQFSEFSTNTCKNAACLDVSNVEYAPKLSAFSKSGFGLKNRTIVADETMEITQQVPIVYKNNYNAHVDGIDKTVGKCNVNRTVISDENMEITQEFPAVYKNICNINKDNIEKTIVKQNLNRTVVTDENMDITQGPPIVYKNTNYNVVSTNISEVFSKDKVNKTVVADANMEFTQQFPTVHKNNIYSVNQNSMGEVLVKGKMNKTIITDENMEFTQQLPAVYKSNNCKVNTHVTDEVLVKDNVNKTIVTDENMEFTQGLPVYKTTNYNDKENRIEGVLVKAKTNRTIRTDENMEFTQQLPAVYKTNYSMGNSVGEVHIKNEINKTVVTDENMEFTQQLPAACKTNYNVVNSVGEVRLKDEINKTVVTDENMEFTQQLPAACETNYNVVNSLGEVRLKDEINKTVVTDENMEFTQQLPAACKTNYNVVNSVGEVRLKDEINKTVVTDENMEFTQQLPAACKTNYNVVNSVGEVRLKDEINKTVVTDENMEFTQQLPAACKTNYNMVNSVGEVRLKDEINKTVVTDENMEFTQQLPAACKTNYNVVNSVGEVRVKDEINKTIITDENTEFTQQLPAACKTNYNVVNSVGEVRVKDEINKTIITDENTEFTQQLPAACKTNYNVVNSVGEVRLKDEINKTVVTDENMEFTQQLPAACKTNYNVVNSVGEVRLKDEINKTVVTDENMEFTQQLPAACKTNYNVVNSVGEVRLKDEINKTVVTDENMEFTQQLPAACKTNYNVVNSVGEVRLKDEINKTVVTDENMEFTQQLPAACKTNYNVVNSVGEVRLKDEINKTVVTAENMEFTQQLPALCKTNYNVVNSVGEVNVKDEINKTIITDENTEFTQQLPAACKTNYNVVNSVGEVRLKDEINKTVVTDENMEFTQQLPAACKTNYNVVNSVGEVRLKDEINKTVVTDENMEFTQQLPAACKTNYNVVNSVGEVRFKDEINKTVVTAENMEFTQQLPAACKTNYNVVNSVGEVNVKDEINKTVITDENTEFTQQLPAACKTNYNVVNSVGEVRLKDEINKTVVTDENMEFTQQLPSVYKTNYNVVNSVGEVLAKDKINITVITDENMEFTQQLPAACKTNYYVVNSVGEVRVKDEINKTGITDENTEFTQQLPAACKTNYNVVNSVGEVRLKDEINKTVGTDENMEFTQQLPSVYKTNYNVVNSVGEVLAKDKINKTVITDENMEFTQLLAAVYRSNNVNVKSTDEVPVTDKLNKTIVTDEIMEFTQQLPIFYKDTNRTNSANNMNEVLEDENKVLQNLLTAAENIVTYNHENNINPNKLKFPTADQSVFINHSISKGVTNENQDSEFNKDGMNITGSTPMDVDSVIMTNELPGGLNIISISANSLLLSPLKREKDKDAFNSAAVGVTSMDNLMISSPLESYKNKVTNDMSQNKEEKLLLELEDAKEKKCLSSNNHEDLDNINQRLPLGNPNEKPTNVSLVLGKNKCINLSNDTLQQFHTGSNNLLKLCPSTNLNLDMFIDGEKCNEFVGGNVNNPEIQIDLEYEETKMVHKNISISKQNISCSGFKTPGSSFHTTFTPCSPGINDTQHLINYSLTHKQPKSDFSKIIAGDLNPSFMNSKYMALSEFSSDAFPVSLETSRANQTHLERMGLDKVKDWDVFPIAAASDQDNDVKFEDEEINKDKIPALSKSSEAVYGNQNNLNAVGIDKNSDLFSDSVETIDSKQVHHAQHMELGDINYDGHNKDKPPLLISIEETNVEANNKEKGRNLKRPSLENIENVVVCKKAMLDDVEMTVADIINLDENMEISTIQINRTANISQEDITLCDDISYVNDMHTEQPLKMTFTHSIEASVSTNISTFEHSVENKKFQELYTNRKQIKQKIEDFMEKLTISLAAITKNAIKLEELYDEESKEISQPFKGCKFIDFKSNLDSSTECSLVEAVSDNNIAEHRSPFHMDSDDGTMDIQKVLTLKQKIEEKQKRCKQYWNALSVVDNKYEFDTLFKTIRLVVLLNPESGIVKKTNIYCNILDDSEPTALYVHNILKERLSQKVIQSAVGEQYDILTLLDYVYMNMQQIVELLNEFNGFAKRFNLKMDKDFRVTFNVVNFHLRSTWCVSIDMSNMDNITENSITAHAKIGSVNEREIKRFVTGCPRGTLFLRNFINNIFGYIELLKKRKTMIKAKVVDII